MTRNVLIFNSQAAGDCLLGTHVAGLYKRVNPDSKVYFATRHGLTASTSEFENESHTLLTLLRLQNHIDGVGYVFRENDSFRVRILTESEVVNFDEIIEQHCWFSNLGIVKSQSYSLIARYGESNFADTETKFNVGTRKQLDPNKLVISIPGPLDWNRKTKNEQMRTSVLAGIDSVAQNYRIPVEIRLTGRDVDNDNLVTSLQTLNNSNLYLGPIGLPAHAGVGLGLDTVCITSVYPAEYDCPEFYHSGWHKTVAKPPNHCGNYSCVTPKIFPDTATPEGPQAKYGFWTKNCEITTNRLSCVNQTRVEDIINLFEQWVIERGIPYLNGSS